MATPETLRRTRGVFRTLGMPSIFEGASDSDGGEDSNNTHAASEITLHPSCSGTKAEQAGLENEARENAKKSPDFLEAGRAVYFPVVTEDEEKRALATSDASSQEDEDKEMASDHGPSKEFDSWFTKALQTRRQDAEPDDFEVEPSETVSKSDSDWDVALPPLEPPKGLEGFHFRVGFGPGNTLAFQKETQPGSCPEWRFLSVGNTMAPREFLREKVRRTLEICHNFSDAVEEGHVPSSTNPGPKRRVVACGRELLEKVAAGIARVNFELREVHGDSLSKDECDTLEHGVETWLLVSTLFGKVSDIGEADPETHLMERRAKITAWIKRSTAQAVENDLRDIMQAQADEETLENKEEADYFGALGLLLSGGRKKEAACLAASKGDARMSVLIAAAGHSQVDYVKEYLALIDEADTSEGRLSPHRRGMYELLAGNMEWLEMDFFLDWRRIFGCYMWYICPETAPIHEVLTTYQNERATYEDRGDVNRPWPHYYKPGNHFDSFDTQYKLLHLYGTLEQEADLEDGQLGELLETSGYSKSPTDVLTSWMLLGVLMSVGAIRSEDLNSCDQILKLHLAMISMCESLDIPEWAVFVATHMPIDAQQRAKVIKEILKRMAPSLEGSSAAPVFMSEKLGVPVQWIHEALAGWYYYKGDQRNQFIHLLQAEHYVQAHDVFCRHIGTIASKTEDNQLGDFVQMMKRAPVDIPMWSRGGAIYLEFERIMGEFGIAPQQEIEEHIFQFEASVREAEVHWAACIPSRKDRIQMYWFYRSMMEKLKKETRRFDTLDLPLSQALY